MKIQIASNGDCRRGDPQNHLRMGNAADQLPGEFKSAPEMGLEIELPNTHCNIGGTDPTRGQQACMMCPRSRPDFKPETDRLEEVCNHLRGNLQNVSKLQFTGLAEPFWQNRVFDLLDLLDIQDQESINVVATTNGTLMTQEVCERWFETVHQSEVRFSLDAGTPFTYTKLRRIPEFDRVVENIHRYCSQRDPDRHLAVLSCNINLLNVKELERIVEITKENFLHYLSLVPTANTGGEISPYCMRPDNESIFSEARKLVAEKATKLGVQVVFSGTWPK